MVKKSSKVLEKIPGRYVPAEDLIRKSISTGLIQMGHMIDLQARQLETMRKMDEVRALSGQEHRFLEEAQEKLERVEKIVFTIGRRNQRGG